MEAAGLVFLSPERPARKAHDQGIGAKRPRHTGTQFTWMPVMPFAPLAVLRRWWSSPQAESRQALAQCGTAIPDPKIPLFNGDAIPKYPARGVAAPAAPPEMLMESQADLINHLHQTSSFSYSEFDALIRPAIRNYAAYVHLLPASETNHHCGQGGLFRHGLEVACNAALACESKVFAMDHWASERHLLTPRWRLCAILGGMMHDMGKPLIDVGALDASGELVWNPHTGSLWDWLQEHALDHYYIHWRSGRTLKRHVAFTPLALYRIVPPRTLAWIGEHGGQEPFDALVMALTGSADPNNPLDDLIRQADSKSVNLDLKQSRARLSASGLGGQRSVAARLVRTMHDTIEAGTWSINKPGSAIWVTTEGVYGMFPSVLREAIETLREQGETELPKDIGDALDLLSDWGHLLANVLPNGASNATWNVRIHGTDREKPMVFDAHVVRFAREEIIPASVLPPAALPAELLGRDGQPMPSGQISVAGAEPVRTAPAEILLKAPSAHENPPADILAQVEAMLRAPAAEPSASATPPPPAAPTPADDVVMRDRGAEQDVRTSQLEQAHANYHKAFPPTTPDGALAWLVDRAQQPEGDVLVHIAQRVQEGVFREGAQVFDANDRIHLRSPEAFLDFGYESVDLRASLEAKGWTETDSPTANRTTVLLLLGGKRIPCTRLTESISTVFRLLLPARQPGQVIQSAPKRAMALGPRIDASTAARLRSRTEFDAADGLLLRPILHAYLHDTAREQGTSADLLTSEQIHGQIAAFARSHGGIRDRGWWFKHILHGNPAVCLSQTKDTNADPKSHQLRVNPDYDPSMDKKTAEQEAFA